MGGENRANRGEDVQTMSKIGETEQWQSVHGWRETGSNEERWRMVYDP